MSIFPVLSCLIFFPLVATAVVCMLRDEKTIRLVTLAASLIELLLAFPLLGFVPEAGYQFIERRSWVPQWGMEYHLALDGISILMVWLTLFTLPLCVLCSWTYIGKRIKEFHVCLLLMTGAFSDLMLTRRPV